MGAGVAGLSAARFLHDSGTCNVVVLEGRNRIGGRVFTYEFPAILDENLGPERIDLGANYMHGCGPGQMVFELACKLGIKSGEVSNGHWESTEVAKWFSAKTGEVIPQTIVVKMHNLFWRIQGRVNAFYTKNQVKAGGMNLQDIYDRAKSEILQENHIKLSKQEEAVLKVVVTKGWGYVSEISELSSSYMCSIETCEEKLNYLLSDSFMKQSVARVRKKLRQSKLLQIERTTKEHKQDRICLGYDWLPNHLCKGLNIHLNSICKRVEAKQLYTTNPYMSITCANGAVYNAHFVICALPLGVLKGRCPRTSVRFDPPLSKEKQSAIDNLGSGAHNKIIFRFRPKDVFWPPDIPQLNTDDPRFNFLNLHAYGKQGLLMAHVFPPLAYNWNGLTDEQVLEQALDCLRCMFRSKFLVTAIPKPVDYKITRWDTDEFSLGSYSFIARECTMKQVSDLATPHFAADDRVLFCGEACSRGGFQCVNGAYVSGRKCAMGIVDYFERVRNMK